MSSCATPGFSPVKSSSSACPCKQKAIDQHPAPRPSPPPHTHVPHHGHIRSSTQKHLAEDSAGEARGRERRRLGRAERVLHLHRGSIRQPLDVDGALGNACLCHGRSENDYVSSRRRRGTQERTRRRRVNIWRVCRNREEWEKEMRVNAFSAGVYKKKQKGRPLTS